MKSRFSPLVFMAVYCIVYGLALFYDAPLFRYYPLHQLPIWGYGSVTGHGPAMAWYGLMAEAILVSLVCSFVIPNGIVDRIFRNFNWIFPVGLMALCVFLMRIFFV